MASALLTAVVSLCVPPTVAFSLTTTVPAFSPVFQTLSCCCLLSLPWPTLDAIPASSADADADADAFAYAAIVAAMELESASASSASRLRLVASVASEDAFERACHRVCRARLPPWMMPMLNPGPRSAPPRLAHPRRFAVHPHLLSVAVALPEVDRRPDRRAI